MQQVNKEKLPLLQTQPDCRFYLKEYPMKSSSISSLLFPEVADLFSINESYLAVLVYPGSTLFTVIPNCPNSFAKVFDQLATAPLIVLETPRPTIGCFTEMEIIFTIRP